MTIEYLKTGKPETERDADDAKTRAIVEATLADIAARGDVAVRELSEKFDNYSPPAFKLSAEEIEALIAQTDATRTGRHPLCPRAGAQLCASPARLDAGYRS